eukprot:3119669-Heterocapsa_arctica.AAC.1
MATIRGESGPRPRPAKSVGILIIFGMNTELITNPLARLVDSFSVRKRPLGAVNISGIATT